MVRRPARTGKKGGTPGLGVPPGFSIAAYAFNRRMPLMITTSTEIWCTSIPPAMCT